MHARRLVRLHIRPAAGARLPFAALTVEPARRRRARPLFATGPALMMAGAHSLPRADDRLPAMQAARLVLRRTNQPLHNPQVQRPCLGS